MLEKIQKRAKRVGSTLLFPIWFPLGLLSLIVLSAVFDENRVIEVDGDSPKNKFPEPNN